MSSQDEDSTLAPLLQHGASANGHCLCCRCPACPRPSTPPPKPKRRYKADYQADYRINYEYQRAYRAAHRAQARERSRLWAESHPEEVRDRNRHRRARLAGVKHEPLTISDVAARDGWRCGICGERVDPRAKGASRKSLDHIVPISRGGPHTLENSQLAHFRCNSAKGARDTIPAQLRLFA